MNKKNRGLSGRVLSALTDHGPLSSYELAERLDVSPMNASAACGHLARREEIQHAPGTAFRPNGPRGKTCYRWQINAYPPAWVPTPATARRVDWEAGITEEDHAWMRRYRQQRERRLAQRGEGDATHADGNR